MQLTGMPVEAPPGLEVIGVDQFHRLGPEDFGMPGLIAIESVGPFVERLQVGPFITIHDSFMEPGLGIGHHPHRGNERLFYILRGQIEHDDALNGITGTMNEGDLARLTEGERGMLHQEWNGRKEITTHAFILVYTPDVEPPIPNAAFDALRAEDRVRVTEGDGVETLQLIGGRSAYRASSSRITGFSDTALAEQAGADVRVPPRRGLIVYPLEGRVRVDDGGEVAELGSSTERWAEGPDAMAIAWTAADERMVRVDSVEGPARLLRIEFERRGNDVVLHRPWRQETECG